MTSDPALFFGLLIFGTGLFFGGLALICKAIDALIEIIIRKIEER